MDPRTKERVERWESRPFSDGEDALATLADEAFSGAVTGAGVWAFMLNGRIVGVVDGSVEALLDASGTIYEAPADALPLLAAMLEQGGEPRAQYYTNDTSLAAVDRKLQQGSFTGYVELSEQVLSGDYYLVYYGGKRMSAAYIGNAERLLTGDEAFERADDEIGIYAVVDVAVSVTDVPGRETQDAAGGTTPDDGGDGDQPSPDAGPGKADSRDEPEHTSTAAGAGGSPLTDDADSPSTAASRAGEAIGTGGLGETADAANGRTAADDTSTPSEGTTDDRSATDPTTITPTGDEPDPTEGPSTNRSETTPGDETETSETEVAYTDAETETSESVPASESAPSSESAEHGQSADRPGITSEREATESSSPGITTAEDSTETDGRGSASGPASDARSADPASDAAESDTDEGDETDEHDERLREEERWRETRQIPSIDPESTSEGSATQQSSGGADSRSRKAQSNSKRSNSQSRTNRSQSQTGQARSSNGQSNARERPSPADVASTEQALRSDMLEREDKIDHLTQRVTELEEKRKQLVRERDELASENDELTETVSRLQTKISELETELERAQSEPAPSGGATPSQPAETASSEPELTLTPQQALEQTNVFVRYGSKSQPTLESAHEGEGSRGDLDRNLQLERHTQFDADATAVNGQPYDSFVEESMQYRFVEWLVGTSLFEIRETGNAADLADLYDVIPRIDRVELAATISLEEDETENVPDQVTFDVAAFDKRGTPLVVANCNDSRDPATQGMLEQLEADASSVCANYPDLAAAVVVTSSFFDPGALELAEEVTTSGFLSRSSKGSYVNLSRKQGYHCCLVESRSGGFHMTVPEL